LVSTITFSRLPHRTHSNVCRSKPSFAGAELAMIMGLWHFGQGRPPIIFDVKAEYVSGRVMDHYPSEAGARELSPRAAVAGGEGICMRPADDGRCAILLTSRNSEPDRMDCGCGRAAKSFQNVIRIAQTARRCDAQDWLARRE
jgi:hypothetical protein